VNAVVCNYTVHMKAISHERLKIVSLLLEHGADVNVKAPTGTNALIRAAEQNHSAIVGLLLEHGADAAVKDANDRTALYFAKRYNFNEVLALLSKAGASNKRSGSCSPISGRPVGRRRFR
jgi:ankyrin repeat protein